jgi:hypothetical protein
MRTGRAWGVSCQQYGYPVFQGLEPCSPDPRTLLSLKELVGTRRTAIHRRMPSGKATFPQTGDVGVPVNWRTPTSKLKVEHTCSEDRGGMSITSARVPQDVVSGSAERVNQAVVHMLQMIHFQRLFLLPQTTNCRCQHGIEMLSVFLVR